MSAGNEQEGRQGSKNIPNLGLKFFKLILSKCMDENKVEKKKNEEKQICEKQLASLLDQFRSCFNLFFFFVLFFSRQSYVFF